MNLTDLLRREGIDPQHVLVLRHCPKEPKLSKWLPWLAAEKPDLFNAYQQTQGKQVESAMTRARYVAAFIGQAPGQALFVGLYSNKGTRSITREQFWDIPAYVELKEYGINWFPEDNPRPSCLWFDLQLTDFYADLKGRLIVRWPPLDKNWYRWAHGPKNEMPISILPESALTVTMPEWDVIDLTWEELKRLPVVWKSKLSEWRAIYYIFDTSDRKGYVGAAYGENNLFGRWLDYAARGHGGNKLLLSRDPRNFRFTILQLVPPDLGASEVVRLESSWKKRLHTRVPHGLNDN